MLFFFFNVPNLFFDIFLKNCPLTKMNFDVFSPGPADAGPRVILSVDLWHPNVAAAERQALDFMFSPDL